MDVKLACPKCHTELKADSNTGFSCSSCNKTFPVKNNIPILIHEHVSVFSAADYMRADPPPAKPASGLKAAIIKSIWTLQKLSPGLTLNVKAKRNYQHFGKLLMENSAKPKVLVIGGKTPGIGIEELTKLPVSFIESDIAIGPLTKVVCDAQYLPFVAEQFDGVIIQAVSEYLPDTVQCAAEIHRVLKPDGLLYSETPFMQQVHGGAHDFTRLTHLGHRRLFRNFEEISSGTCVGTGSALTYSYRHFLISLTDKKFIQEILSLYAVWTSFFLKYIDYLTIDNRVT